MSTSKSVPEKKEKLYDFLEEHFIQMQSARAPNGWEYIFLCHRETSGRAVVQIRGNESGQFGFELFVPATHSKDADEKFEAAIEYLENITSVRRQILSSND